MGPEQQKAREVGPQVRPGDPGVPRAVGLRLIRALPGETGLVCHRLHWTRLRLVKRHLPLGRQACTISPSAMRRARLARFSRPPHPAPNVRDDRDTPLSEEAGRGLVMLSWGLGEEEYFLRADWTGCVALNLLAKFVFSARPPRRWNLRCGSDLMLRAGYRPARPCNFLPPKPGPCTPPGGASSRGSSPPWRQLPSNGRSRFPSLCSLLHRQATPRGRSLGSSPRECPALPVTENASCAPAFGCNGAA